jgi:DNA (cytosine-5)-methyltransferase 1
VDDACAKAGRSHSAAEFFAGIGLVGAALDEWVDVVYANDISPVKFRLFSANYNAEIYHVNDIRHVHGSDIPDIHLATASFPCTDLSLAGNRAGLDGKESGMFWEFARVLKEMEERKPQAILLENVVGFFSSNGGEDLYAAFEELNRLGYYCDLVFVDAKWFLPQSRPRVFIIGSRHPLKADRLCAGLSPLRPAWFLDFAARHPQLKTQALALTPPATQVTTLDTLIERLSETDSRWWNAERTASFLDSLSPINGERVRRLVESETLAWRTAYRRTRDGKPVWEIREDGISGCLRTARGGSSKQALLEAGAGMVRVRWMTAREYARLQGVPDFKFGDATESQAIFGFGDAVCVPAVRYIVREYIVPLLLGEIAEEGATLGKDQVHAAA